MKLNATKLGISAGIVGAIVVLLTTITGMLGYSEAYMFFANSVWKSFGYSATLTGAIIGAILGFVYAFAMVWLTIKIYNKLNK